MFTPRLVRTSRRGLRPLVATFGSTIALMCLASSAWAAGSSSLDVLKSSDRGAAPASASIMNSTLTAPVTTATDADVTLVSSWIKTNATLKAGSVVAPAGWNVEYFDGTTWFGTEPADPTVVESVRTTGRVRSRGDGGSANTLLTDSLTTTHLSGAPASFGASVGGDGYNIAFPDTDRVINVFHHNGPTQGVDVVFDCHLRSSGITCPEGQISFTGYRNANNGVVAVNATTKRAYSPVFENSTGHLGFLCVDYSLATPAACTTAFIQVSAYSVMTTRNDMGGAASDGRWFFVVNGANHRLYCLDMTTGSICTGFGDHGSGSDGYELPANSFEGPYAANGMGWTSDISVIAGKLYYHAGNRPQNRMGCIDPVTAAACTGSTPILNGSQTPFDFPPIPLYDTSGTLTGVCLVVNRFCISPDGQSSVSMPAALASFLTPTGVPGSGIQYFGGYSVYLSLIETTVVGQRLFIPVEAGSGGVWNADWPSDLACWDYSTAAPCAITGHDGAIFNLTPQGRLYSANTDPFSTCVWVNSDSGHIAAVGSDGGVCGGSAAQAEFGFDEITARLGCDGATDLISWKQLNLTLPTGVSLSDVKLSILDGTSTPVTDWNAITPSSLTVDLTGLAVTTTSSTPTFVVTVENAGLTQVSQITAELQLVAKPPQLCIRLVPTPVCSTGKSSDGLMLVPEFVVSGSTTVTANSTPVTETPVKIVSNADYDANTLCGGGGSGGGWGIDFDYYLQQAASLVELPDTL